ncbi:MAG: FecR domain-containing protein [Desulfobacterales bacterium]|nr:FecR domain-containing protein [Desulfobacterales bacterium]
MKITRNRKFSISVIALLAICLVCGITTLYSADAGTKLLDTFKPFKPRVALIPDNVKISSDFVGGVEKRVGQVQKTQGKVYVIHKDGKTAYRLKAKLPVFEGDTIITGSRSRINAVMDDQSVLAMAPYAKLVISKLKYNKKKNTRSTVMGLFWGSARFIVKKLSGKPDYKVRTETAVCGVRGTDFAVSVAPAPKGMTSSAVDRFLTFLNPVQEAHASPFALGQIVTAALTGPGSSVGLGGMIGGTTFVGPASIASALTGAAASTATALGTAVAGGVLGAVGPGLGTLAMPPEFD